MTTKIQKWGNSLAVRIPNKLAESLNWKEGSSVGFEQLQDKIIISSAVPKYTLEDMVKGITKKNRHPNMWVDDAPRGKEVW